MEFDLSKIEMSESDLRRGINLPKYLTTELAEFIGIVIGDGHLNFSIGEQKNGKPLIRSDIVIACNKKEDDYIKYVSNLHYFLFNIKLSNEPDKRSETVLLRSHSKGILQFLNKICEIPKNRKTDIVFVSDIIKNADCELKYAFLRGLADTDFSVIFRFRPVKGHNYPTIKAAFKSKTLVKDLEFLFKELGFKCSAYYDLIKPDKRFGPTTINHIYIYGRKNFNMWIDNIGFSNPKFIRKIEKWQKDGVCPQGY